MRSHRQPATMLLERNLGAGPEIFECDLVPTESKFKFRIGASRDVLIARGGNKSEGVTISGIFVHPYLRPGVEISSRVEHEKTLESGRSSVEIAISECEMKVFTPK
ncbi:hypothetical protein Taro_005945 [Colocasia esculenta]|uniref:Uncharacterized protein n=1 Tax=Colocasia esculenta TaxID=4460 RepID=A0A843TR93_COLES|nr:hypothetical protein [Colocasia esculenta]